METPIRSETSTAIKRNYWSVFDETPYVGEFAIEFENFHSIEIVFEFIEAIINASKQNEIYLIDVDNSPEKYIDYLKSQWTSEGCISPFSLKGYKHYSEYFRHPYTKLSFYENGQIIEAFVSDMCNILEDPSYIRLSENKNLSISESINTGKLISKNQLQPPIKFDMNTFRKNQVPYPVWALSGQISSDIWLREVNHYKVWNDDMSDYNHSRKRDNSELAGLNAPRLKSFMRSLKKISQDFGGKWYFESTFGNTDIKAIEGHT
jgi:hypothetical protein